MRVGVWWELVIAVLVPVQAVVLFVWWLVQAREWDDAWLAPFHSTNVGTVLFQIALALVVLIALNRWIARRSGGDAPA